MTKYLVHNARDVLLEFSEKDFNLIHKLAFDFQFYYLTFAELYENLAIRGTDGSMSYEQYSCLFKDLGSSKDDDAKLAAIFRGFDRTESNLCDITELTCGLTILCQG